MHKAKLHLQHFRFNDRTVDVLVFLPQFEAHCDHVVR